MDMEGFKGEESKTGVRFAWNVWPTSRIEASRITAPFGTMYTPLKALLGGGPPRVPYAPLRCRHCNGVVSPHSRVDFVRKSWLCAFCHANNNFPPHYSGMSESCLPAELFPGNQVIEYQLSTASTSAGAGAGAGGIHSTSSNGNSSHSPSSPFSYLFVVDLVLQEMDLKSSLKAFRHALELIPANSRVGLITFGDMIQVSQEQERTNSTEKRERERENSSLDCFRMMPDAIILTLTLPTKT